MTAPLLSRLGASLLLSTVAASAAAQTTADGASLTVTLTTPTNLVDCGVSEGSCPALPASCAPLNLTSCGEATTIDPRELDLEITVNSGVTAPVPGADLLVWLETEASGETADKRCIYKAGTLIVPAQELLLAGPLVSGAYLFPEDVADYDEDDRPYVSTRDVWAQLVGTADPCTEADEGTLRLCFGVDELTSAGALGTDGEINATEKRGWLLIGADSSAPPAPNEPTVVPRDAALAVSVAWADADSAAEAAALEVARIPTTDASVDCAAPPAGGSCNSEILAIGAGNASTGFDITGLSNGQRYAICVRALDSLGNASPWATAAFGTPRDECDFIECYPGRPPSGYCGAAFGAWPPLVVSLMLWWQRRRRGRHEQRDTETNAALRVAGAGAGGAGR